MKLVFFITIPAMAGLMALDEQIVSMLFGHGVFKGSATPKTAECLFFLSFGLWSFTGSRLFVTLYYALADVKIPFYSGVITIVLNLILCLLLIDSFGLKGLAVSISISSATGFAILLINIPGKVKIEKLGIIVSACRSLFLSAIMFFIVQQAACFLPESGTDKLWYGTGVIGCIGLGAGFYFIVNLLMASPEFKILKKGMI